MKTAKKNKQTNPRQSLMFLLVGGRITRAIYAVTKAGVPDILRNQPMSVDQIAKKAKAVLFDLPAVINEFRAKGYRAQILSGLYKYQGNHFKKYGSSNETP